MPHDQVHGQASNSPCEEYPARPRSVTVIPLETSLANIRKQDFDQKECKIIAIRQGAFQFQNVMEFLL
ncbi:MAG: hypothetical protein V2A34_11885 [Lentisphaerota bacterium]